MQGAWTQVLGKKERKRQAKAKADAASIATTKKAHNKQASGHPRAGALAQGKAGGDRKDRKPPKINVPKHAAVVLTAVNSDRITVAEALAKVRSKIELRSMGIESLRQRRAATGAIIYEVPGEASSDKADQLATKLREELNPKEVKVARPTKMAELRLSGLDDMTESRDVVEALAAAGGCVTWEIQVGTIRRLRGGLGSVWARCPAVAARKLVETGKIRVGWVIARVEVLRARPMLSVPENWPHDRRLRFAG